MPSIRFKQQKPTPLERFGVYYLDLFRKKDLTHHAFDLSDSQLAAGVRRISTKGILLSALTGLVCVWPTVYVGVLRQQDPWWVQYAWIGAATIASILVEFYALFVIALRAVHEVSELINIHSHANTPAAASPSFRSGAPLPTRAPATPSAAPASAPPGAQVPHEGAREEIFPDQRDFLRSGPFSITNILSRAALEIQDPELHILGIDPFKRVSKKNLLLLGLLYKCKIILTNFIAKWLLLHTVGPTIGGISIFYIALPVECFWNAVVLKRVVKEARLRLFGFALCNEVADRILRGKTLQDLSPTARTGCMRAIGNAVVLARNYHPNMIVLALRFQHLLHLHKDHRYDDWDLFLQTLQEISEKERFFLLNLFTLAIAFDGRISHIEADNLKDAYAKDYPQYRPRLLQLTAHLHAGRLNAALALCKTDFTAG